MKNILLIGCLLFFVSGFSQSTIYGFVEDKETKERLPGVSVYDAKSQAGTVTNSFGFYSLSLPTHDSIFLVFSSVGYESKKIALKPNASKRLNIALKRGVELPEVLVLAHKNRIKTPEISILSIPVHQISKMPALMGEADIMRTFQLMPGVQGGKEGTSGIYVRGGSPDQNQILLDDIPLYYVNHIGGYVSVFNPNAIKNVELYKGAFPARYGGKISSIMDIRMKDGNMNDYEGNVSVGLISGKFTIEGPIIKDKASFIISARRSLFDLFTRGFQYLNDDDISAGYTLYDLNAKINYKIDANNRIYLSAYSGRDRILIKQKGFDTEENSLFDFSGKRDLNWGNYALAFRWNHVYSNRFFSNLTLGYTKFFYNSLVDTYKIEKSSDKTVGRLSNHYLSSIKDIILKADFHYYTHKHKIKFGGGSIYHNFTPTVNSIKQLGMGNSSVDTTFGAKSTYPLENFLYVEDKITVSQKLNFNIGAHVNLFSTHEDKFWSIEPRIIGNYIINDKLSVKASYSKMSQAAHLLSNSGMGVPSDLWVPATKKAPPQKSTLYALGVVGDYQSRFEWSIETFYKTFDNLITFSNGASFFNGTTDWQDKIEHKGQGKAYGVELLLQKKTGITTGWISYCLSKNTRQFENINQGKPYPFKYDRRHDVSIVVNHNFSEHLQMSASWVFSTGNAITLPLTQHDLYVLEWVGNGLIDEGFTSDNISYIYDEAHIYEQRNNYRMPTYHRLDLSFNFIKKKGKKTRTWSVGVYNAYNRLNTYFLYFKQDKNGNKKLYSYTLFPIMPSVSYSYTF